MNLIQNLRFLLKLTVTEEFIDKIVGVAIIPRPISLPRLAYSSSLLEYLIKAISTVVDVDVFYVVILAAKC